MKSSRLITVRLLLLCLCTAAGLILPAQEQDYAQERRRMVDRQIRQRGVGHIATLDAMRMVERHLFMPEDVQRIAYEDHAVPIGYGQTISQPYIVAYMTDIVNPAPGQRILEIGTGSGYQAAVLAEIVDTVYSMEIVRPLHTRSTRTLEDLGYDNVVTRHADGYYGWPEKGPFDAIVVTAAAEFIPPPLIQQLKEGGNMIIPVGSPFMVQWLMLVKKSDGKTQTTKMMPVRFVPFTRG